MARSLLHKAEEDWRGSRAPVVGALGTEEEVWRCTQVAVVAAVCSRRTKIGGEVGGHGWSCVDREEGTHRRTQGPVAGAVSTQSQEDWKDSRGAERKPVARGFLYKEAEDCGLRKVPVDGAVSTKRTIGDNVSDRGPRLCEHGGGGSSINNSGTTGWDCVEVNEECSSGWFSSVAQSTLCDPMDCSTPGLPILHQLLEFTQTHVH